MEPALPTESMSRARHHATQPRGLHVSTNEDSPNNLVAEHDVRYRIWPHQAVVGGELVTTGFDVELTGRHVRPEHPPEPGCEECVDVHRSLRRIAEAALPPERAQTMLHIRAYEPSLVMSSPDGPALVRLTIEVAHREGPNGEVDLCERGCVDELVDNLRGLGVRQG